MNLVGLKHEALTEKIIKAYYTVYNELGHGFLESVYEEAMAISLREAGLRVDLEPSHPHMGHLVRETLAST